jgi:hypothetical protein
MPKRPAPAATPENIYAELAKLCRYVDSLQREVARLAMRIQPYDGEKPPDSRPWIDDVPDTKPSAQAAMKILNQLSAQAHAWNTMSALSAREWTVSLMM